MTILLLGSKGMLGSELFSMLKFENDVVGKDIHDFDIASRDDWWRLIDEIRRDFVINAVAYTDVDGCEINRDKCFTVNAEGVKKFGPDLPRQEGYNFLVTFKSWGKG